MPDKQNSISALPCTSQPLANCGDCQMKGRLLCRFDRNDMLHFFMIILPYAAVVISGAIRAGYGIYLLLWLTYSLSFFFIWEAYILCRHCPFWAEPGRVLHCHANYGVIKIWKYQPGPMSRSERIQFILGALIWIGFPFPLLLLGREYLLSFIGLCAAISAVYLLKKNVCSRCVNFSCPLNNVPKPLVDAYLRRNPQMRSAWENAGYQLD